MATAAETLSYYDEAERAVLAGDIESLRTLLAAHGKEIRQNQHVWSSKGGIDELLATAIHDYERRGDARERELAPHLYPEIVQCLIDHGGNVNQGTFDGHQLLARLLSRYVPYTGANRSDGMHGFKGYRTPSNKIIIAVAKQLVAAGADLEHKTSDALCMAYGTRDLEIIRFMEDVYAQAGIRVPVKEKLHGLSEAIRLGEDGYEDEPAAEMAILEMLRQQIIPDEPFGYPSMGGIPHVRTPENDEEIASYRRDGMVYNHAAIKLASAIAALPDAEEDRYFRPNFKDSRKEMLLENSPYYYQYKRDEPDTEFFLRQDYLARAKEALAALPGRKQYFGRNAYEDYAFERVVGVAYAMAQNLNPHIPHTPSDLLVDLLGNERDGWGVVWESLPANAMDSARLAKDAFTGFMRALVLPEMLRQFRRRGIRVGSIDFDRLEAAVLPEIVDTLTQSRTFKTILGLGEEWHNQMTRIESVRKFERSGTWPALAEDFTAKNGCTIHFLTSAEDVKEQVERVQVEGGTRCCAQSYIEQFKTGKMHIACVADASGKALSTLGLERDSKAILSVTENVGPGNATLADDHPAQVAVDEFLARVRADDKSPDKIAIDFRALDADHRRRANIRQAPYLDLIGHDPFAEDAALYEKKYLDAYSNVRLRHGSKAPFIPGHGKTDPGYTTNQFLQDTGLDRVIKDCVGNRMLQRAITSKGLSI